MTKRSESRAEPLDVSPMIRSIQYLEEVLRRGVVVGVYQDSMQVEDADIERALKNVQSHIANLTVDMERALKVANRLNGHPAPQVLQ